MGASSSVLTANSNIMYILDQNNNILQKARICTFKELNLEERKHLQEWIAAEPSSLGEELLIIQKEFDGFADTKERLDLLALDKQGCLVIIENKLDDSGRDVTWQAIKYASYCSSLSKSEIIQMYQKYLGEGHNAEEMISEFMDGKEIKEIDLNPDNSQRIFFVAANFRKEVTSSVLWLTNFNLRLKCFKVTPYKYGDRVLIDFDQIIPIKDTEEYTIKMATKKQEAVQDAGVTAANDQKRQAFWQKFIEYNKAHNGPYSSASGTSDRWLGKSLGFGGISCEVTINNPNIRTSVTFNIGDKTENKKAFDYVAQFKDEIEKALPDYDLSWERGDDKVTSVIRCTRTGLGLPDDDRYDEIISYLTTSAQAFIQVFGKYIAKYKKLSANHHASN